jgi:site-specific recombinase XerD
MALIGRFIKLMKSEQNHVTIRKHHWIIDESKCLTFDETMKMRNYCKCLKRKGLQDRKFTPIRNWFMIELGLNAGLRVEEMASLKHSNLLINGEKSSIVVIGKGNKKRAIWISSEFKDKCFDYIDSKRILGFKTDEDSYLLNNVRGGKITKRALQKFFKEIIESAILPCHYHIHCLRHTYATFLLKASRHNYRFVQQQLGHASIKTTQVYASIIESDRKEALEKLYMIEDQF